MKAFRGYWNRPDAAKKKFPDIRGVRVSVPELVGLRSEANQLLKRSGDSMAGFFPGDFHSLFRGRGLEFEEVRAYQSGDDYRTLDWRVTARTGRLHTKLFEEEREHLLFILADAGPSMHFGTRNAFKWVTAARTAALFAWLADENRDRIGGIVFGESDQCRQRRPVAGQTGLLGLFSLLAQVEPFTEQIDRQPDGFNRALTCLQRHARPGSSVLLLSDFRTVDKKAVSSLLHLARHHRMLAIMIYDFLEAELPLVGSLPFSDGRDRLVLETTDLKVRASYQTKFKEHQASVAQLMRRTGIKFISLGTHEPLIEALRRGLFPSIRETISRAQPEQPAPIDVTAHR